jgi:hemerythrin-like metal-binding domain
MELIKWKDSYSCGIDSIDEQHKVIFVLINKVFDAIQGGKTHDVIKGVFIELLEYANYHFALESQLFELYHYADEQKHLDEHRWFIKKIQIMMIHDYLTGKENLLETLHFLVEWFTDHILKTDMEYCKYFRFKEVLEEVDVFVRVRKFNEAYQKEMKPDGL